MTVHYFHYERCGEPASMVGKGRPRLYCSAHSDLAYAENARALKHERGARVIKPCLAWVRCSVCTKRKKRGVPTSVVAAAAMLQ